MDANYTSDILIHEERFVFAPSGDTSDTESTLTEATEEGGTDNDAHEDKVESDTEDEAEADEAEAEADEADEAEAEAEADEADEAEADEAEAETSLEDDNCVSKCGCELVFVCDRCEAIDKLMSLDVSYSSLVRFVAGAWLFIAVPVLGAIMFERAISSHR